MKTTDDTQLRERARKRVQFRIHCIVFCVINSALWIIWFFTNRGHLWPVWPMTAWGTSLAIQYTFDYRAPPFFSKEEEYKKLKDKQRKRMVS